MADTAQLSELLRNPDDLDKIPGLRSEFSRKKSVIDEQLKDSLKAQLEVSKAGMSSIQNGQRTVNAIKDEMMKIDKLCAEAQNLIRDFPDINIVSQTHRNFIQVEELRGNIDSFERRMEQVEGWLREDDQDLENQVNLLPIHFELSKLRDFKDMALDQGRDSTDAAELINNLQVDRNGTTLQDYFNKLDEVVDWFDEHVGVACTNLIGLVQSNNTGLVVRLALIVEEEEKRDKKVQAVQDAQKEFKDVALKLKSINTGQKELRGYKDKFIQSIEFTAQSQLDTLVDIFAEEPEKLDKSMRWYFNDLNAVKLGMVNLMPRKWKIYRTYTNIYHKLLHDWLLQRIEDPALKPPQILAIINWIERYYAKMAKLGWKEDQLQPHLIDKREGELLRDYSNVITNAVDEWMDRIGKQDRNQFINRKDDYGKDDPLDRQAEYRTKSMGDMWTMLREQLAVAGSSSRPDIVEGVVEAMFVKMKSRRKMWQELVDQEAGKYSGKDADNAGMASLQDWLIAIANDQIACIDDDESQGIRSYITQFGQDFSPLVTDAFAGSSVADLDSLRDDYVDLATHCVHTFVEVVFNMDFRSVLSEFFTPAWYRAQNMSAIVTTFDDYLNDFTPILHPSMQEILVEEFAEALLVAYLRGVRNKGVKFRRSDPFVEKIKEDLTTVFEYFGQYASFGEIKRKWRAVEGLVNFLEAPKVDVADVFQSFRAEYWDTQLGWVEAVLKSRDDYERAMLSAVKTRAAEVPPERGRPETIMAKVK